MAAGEDTERSPCVADIREAEQSIDDRDGVMQRHSAIYYILRHLISDYDETKAAGDDPCFATQAAAPEFRTAAQRAQTVGWLASVPTSVSYFQQRSHLRPSAFETAIWQFNSSV